MTKYSSYVNNTYFKFIIRSIFLSPISFFVSFPFFFHPLLLPVLFFSKFPSHFFLFLLWPHLIFLFPRCQLFENNLSDYFVSESFCAECMYCMMYKSNNIYAICFLDSVIKMLLTHKLQSSPQGLLFVSPPCSSTHV